MDIFESLYLRPSRDSTMQMQADLKVMTDASIESKPSFDFCKSPRSEDQTVMDPGVVVHDNTTKSSNIDDCAIAEGIPATTIAKVSVRPAKEALQGTYKEKFDVEQKGRETTTTTTTVTKETVVVEDTVDHEEAAQVFVNVKETGFVASPAISKRVSWLRRIIPVPEALVPGCGSVTVGAAVSAAFGPGHVASCGLSKVDGIWKRTLLKIPHALKQWRV
ncbi:hypothetical protein BGZ72_007273 [Mortierella alpina]|nr:hypothetical protein BGZ72_007273 [Mortierella alpina]